MLRAPTHHPSFSALSPVLLYGFLLAPAFADIADLHVDFVYPESNATANFYHQGDPQKERYVLPEETYDVLQLEVDIRDPG